MNKTLIISGLIGIVAIGGIWALTQGGGNDTVNGDSMSAENTTPENFTGSIEELFLLGNDVMCTFTQDDAGTRVDGTVYLAAQAQRIRADFTASAQGQTMEGSVIRKDGTNFTWGTTPFGTFATQVKVEDTKAQAQESNSVDFDQSMDYSCAPWRVDNSKFDLPSGIEFTDINAQVMQIDAAVGGVQDLQCSACDNIPDANAKTQCRAALGC